MLESHFLIPQCLYWTPSSNHPLNTTQRNSYLECSNLISLWRDLPRILWVRREGIPQHPMEQKRRGLPRILWNRREGGNPVFYGVEESIGWCFGSQKSVSELDRWNIFAFKMYYWSMVVKGYERIFLKFGYFIFFRNLLVHVKYNY